MSSGTCESQIQKKKGLAKVAKARSIGSNSINIDDEVEVEVEALKVLVDPGSSAVPSVLLTYPISIPVISQDAVSVASGISPTKEISAPGEHHGSSSIQNSGPVDIPTELIVRYIRKDSIKDKSLPSSVENDKSGTSSDQEGFPTCPKETKKEESEVSPKISFFQSINRRSFKKKKADKEKSTDNRSRSPSPLRSQLAVPKTVARSRSLSRLSDIIDNVHHICLTPTKTVGYLEANVQQQVSSASSPNSLMVASPSSVSSSPNINPNPSVNPYTKSEYLPYSVSNKNTRQSRSPLKTTIVNNKFHTNIVPVSSMTKSYKRTSSTSRVGTIVEHQVLKSFTEKEQNGRVPTYMSYIKNKQRGRRNKNNNRVTNKCVNVTDSPSSNSTSDSGSKTNTDSSNSSPSSVATSMPVCEKPVENGMTLHSSRVSKKRSGRPVSWNTLDHSSFEDDISSEDLESQSQESEASDELSARRWSSLGQLSATASESAPLFQVKLSEAKQKNYLFGGLGSLLGTTELSRYFPDRNVVIFIATWNMNGKEPPYSLDDFLLPDDMEHMPDMFVIGTQESVGDRTEWEVRLQTSIGPSHVLFHSAVLGILHLTVFLRRDLVWFCSVPEEGYHSLRPGTYFKTKGAIAISFQFFGTKMLFVNTHLFAHEEKLQQRVQNYKQIIHNLDLPRNLKSKGMTKPKDVTNRYDVVFWLGDLNFRLVGPRDEILERTKDAKTLQSNIEDILCFDQLNHAKNRGEIFQGFSEGKINFPPTFKFDVGTNHYDSSSKQRVPSYTDRILFKSTRDPVRCTNYGCCPNFKTSDHKPVWGMFHFKVRPGKDDIPLAAGLFQRDVYLTALKRRRRFFHQPSSRNCNTQ